MVSKKKNKDINEEFDEKIYIQERKILIEGGRESAKAFDKAILTLSASAFGISITFINKLIPNFKAGTSCFLLVSWILFFISISSTLIALLMSQKAHDKAIDILDKGYSDNIDEKNPYSNITGILNWTSVISFILGAFALLIFSNMNM